MFENILTTNSIYEKNKIFVIDSKFRGMGQSFLCAYMSNKFKYDIIVNNIGMKKYVEYIINKYNFKCSVLVYSDPLRGCHSSNIILDGLFFNNYKTLIKSEYYNIYGFIC